MKNCAECEMFIDKVYLEQKIRIPKIYLFMHYRPVIIRCIYCMETNTMYPDGTIEGRCCHLVSVEQDKEGYIATFKK